MRLNELLKYLQSIRATQPSYNDPEIVVVVKSKSFPSTPCVKISSVSQGFDWDEGKILIRTEKPVLTA